MPIYKQDDGTYLVRVNYTDRIGNHKVVTRRGKTITTRKKAREIENEILEEIQINDNVTSSMTFENLYHHFIQDKEKEYKASTLRHYKNFVPLYVLPLFGKIKLTDISTTDIQRWKNITNEMDIEYSTKCYYFQLLRALFNYAVNVYGLENNPCKKVGKFKAPIKEDEPLQFWNYDEFKLFQAKAKEKLLSNDNFLGSGIYTMLNILYFAGLRKGEANCLTWDDLIYKNGYNYIKVNKSINLKANPYEITGTKNKSSIREVAIPDELLSILQDHYALSKKCVGFDKSWFVCGGLIPIKDTTLCKYKNDIAKECGLPQIKIHSFRHSFCSLLINGNVPLSVVAQQLGHADTKMTQRIYSHIFPESSIKGVEYINSLTKK